MASNWKWMMAASMVPMSANAVLINEVRHDDPGGDTEEYVELIGTPGNSLTGLTFLVIGDDAGASKSGVIESVVSLDGFSLGSNGLFLMAFGALGQEPTFTYSASGPVDLTTTALVLENGDNVSYLLVSGFTGTLGQDLDAVDELANPVLDVTPWASILDVVSLFDGDNLGDFASSEINYGPGMGWTTLGPDGINPPAHIYRLPGGDWQEGPFDGTVLDTPGAANVPEPSAATLLGVGAAAMLRRRSR